MNIIVQHKGKAYAFDFIDEHIPDLLTLVQNIEDSLCPELPMSPEEITRYLRARKADPGMDTQ